MEPSLSEEVRQQAAAQWGWGWLVAWAPIGGGLRDLASSGFGWLVVSVLLLPFQWAWRRLFGKRPTREEAFVAWHASQMDLLANAFIVAGLLTCSCGFPVLLVPALLVTRAGKRAAARGEWYRVPVVGGLLRLPAEATAPHP